jgi:hypothetical protein
VPGVADTTAVEQKLAHPAAVAGLRPRARQIARGAGSVGLRAEAPDEWLGRVPEYHKHLAERMKSVDLATDILIHMDFHPLNVVGVGDEVTGILDWASRRRRPPRGPRPNSLHAQRGAHSARADEAPFAAMRA